MARYGRKWNTPACEDRDVDLDLGALFRPGGHPSGWRRMPAVAGEAMIATSHPVATAAGLEAFEAGGNAVDAALAAATILPGAEPTDNGLGGDAFALVWHDETLYGLNAPDGRRAPSTRSGSTRPARAPSPFPAPSARGAISPSASGGSASTARSAARRSAPDGAWRAPRGSRTSGPSSRTHRLRRRAWARGS